MSGLFGLVWLEEPFWAFVWGSGVLLLWFFEVEEGELSA